MMNPILREVMYIKVAGVGVYAGERGKDSIWL